MSDAMTTEQFWITCYILGTHEESWEDVRHDEVGLIVHDEAGTPGGDFLDQYIVTSPVFGEHFAVNCRHFSLSMHESSLTVNQLGQKTHFSNEWTNHSRDQSEINRRLNVNYHEGIHYCNACNENSFKNLQLKTRVRLNPIQRSTIMMRY
ncbi:unnamed protein product [Nesidiocoris tenuis]|uniref:Uncharacterized protein n=1 Tax=Nesidiocoris tenuis TaxID=355587 RepID=A0A6H5GV79_9HEMI|nr:unnamed protein product [Nesidiocoris tenuis]